jgi:tetratricopeptide (TPR) repeat protein
MRPVTPVKAAPQRALKLPVLPLLLTLALCLPGRAAGADAVFLLVPLLKPPGAEEWLSTTLDKILEEKFGTIDGAGLSQGDDLRAALLRLMKQPRIGPEELVEAMERGGADYAVVGQFIVDDDVISLDLRLFSAQEKRQTASFLEEGFLDDPFSLFADAAAYLAAEAGVVVAAPVEAEVVKPPTTSLEAYRAFSEAGTETDPKARIALLKEAVELDPSYFGANQRLGLSLYQMGMAQEALPYLERAAQLETGLPEAHNNLAVLYAQLGRREEALAEFEKALKLKPDYPEARLNYGRLLEENGRFDEAEGVYSDLLDIDPENVKARSSLALLYEKTGRTELAIQEYRILSRSTPELAENYFLKSGRQARKEKKYSKAEKFFRRAVDVNPQLAEGYAELGVNAYFAGEHEKSVEYFRQSLALEPQRGEYHHYLGLAQEKSGRRQEAQKSFRRSVELGGPLESRVSLARIYLGEGETGQAIDELNLVLDEDPAQEEAQNLLSRAMNRAAAEKKKERERAEFATHRLERLEVIIEQLNRTNRELENRVYALQNGRKGIEKELEELRAEKERRETRYGDRMEDALRSIKQLSDSEELENLRREYLAQVSELERSLTGKERALQEARLALEEAEEMRLPPGSDVSRELVRERKKSGSLQETIASLGKELDESEQEAKRLRDQVRILEKNDSERLDTVGKLERRVESLQSEKLEEGKELSTMTERNRGLARKVTDLEKALEGSERSLKGLRGEVEDLKEESGKSVGEAADLRERTALLRSKKDAHARELEELRRGYGDLTVKVTELERDLAGARQSDESARAKADDLQERLLASVSGREREVAEMRERESAALAESDGLRQSVVDLEARLAGARQSDESARAKADDLQERLLASVSGREREVAEIRERESAALAEKDGLRRFVVDLEARLAEALENLDAAQAGFDERLGAEQERYRAAYETEQRAGEAYERVQRDLVGQALELGMIHMRNRSWEKARLYLQRVVEIDPRNAEAYYSLGEIYFQLGRFELSKQMYKKAGEIY